METIGSNLIGISLNKIKERQYIEQSALISAMDKNLDIVEFVTQSNCFVVDKDPDIDLLDNGLYTKTYEQLSWAIAKIKEALDQTISKKDMKPLVDSLSENKILNLNPKQKAESLILERKLPDFILQGWQLYDELEAIWQIIDGDCKLYIPLLKIYLTTIKQIPYERYRGIEKSKAMYLTEDKNFNYGLIRRHPNAFLVSYTWNESLGIMSGMLTMLQIFWGDSHISRHIKKVQILDTKSSKRLYFLLKLKSDTQITKKSFFKMLSSTFTRSYNLRCPKDYEFIALKPEENPLRRGSRTRSRSRSTSNKKKSKSRSRSTTRPRGNRNVVSARYNRAGFRSLARGTQIARRTTNPRPGRRGFQRFGNRSRAR